MKHAKKLVSLLLALVMVMVMGLTITVSAENGSEIANSSGKNDATGKITIENPVEGQTYTIYQILTLESYDTASGAYSYKTTEAWENFIQGGDIKGVYVNIDAQGYVTWISNKDAAEFAKLAQAYAKTLLANQGAIEASKAEGAEELTVEFEELNLGYYLVDSTLGTLCSLNTTANEVVMKEKNGVPTNEKKVEEDLNSDYGSTNDADLGQTINFQSTITAQPGAENYVFHDKMSPGLTFGQVTGVTLNGDKVEATVEEGNQKVANYTIKTGNTCTDGCTFEVVFAQSFCDTLEANNQLVISYTAVLNQKANVGLEGNKNSSWLEYGENCKTTISTTTTYTWDMKVFKYTQNVDEQKPLAGAKFILLNKDKKQAAKISDDIFDGWVDVNDGTTLASDEDGFITISGLDSDTYYLREIEAPAGYNKRSGEIEVKITGATEGEDNVLSYTTVCAEIENKSGTVLPSTGGIGTTIFYVIGGVLVLGAVVLLVTRKRMDS